jgi:hypothetical protein
MRVVLAAALALPLTVYMLEHPAPESTTSPHMFSSDRTSTGFKGSAVMIAERQTGKHCFRIFGACW